MAGRNALILEMGGVANAFTPESLMGLMRELRATWSTWKAEGRIEEVHEYLLVTGNRTERTLLVVLDLDHEQLEALVVHESWIALSMKCMGGFHNFSTHRAIDLERVASES